MTYLRTHAKAIVSGLVTLAAYLVGVIPAEGSFADVSIQQWLGAVVFVGAAYGFTAGTPNHTPDVLARIADDGSVLAGEAAKRPTGNVVPPDIEVGDLA